MNSRAAKSIAQSRGIDIGRKGGSTRIKEYPLSLPDEVARELTRQPDLIEPILDALIKLNLLLPTLGLDKVSALEVFRDPDAFPRPRFQITVVSARPMPSEQWMRTWGVLSEAITEPMRTRELRRRVFVYLDPGW